MLMLFQNSRSLAKTSSSFHHVVLVTLSHTHQRHPPAHPPPQATAQKREREAIDFPETDERAAKFQKG